MSRKLFQITFSILLLTGMLLGFAVKDGALANVLQTPASQANPDAKFEAGLLAKLTAGPADFFVTMAEQADVSGAAQLQTKTEKGQYVFDSLVATADRTQADLRSFLDSQGVDYKSFYIVNTILIKSGSLDLAQSIAARPDVAAISENHTFQLDEPIIDPAAPNQPNAVESNISFVKADQVWAMGYSGQGMVVAGNDTGLYYQHPALIRQYRGCQDPPTCSVIDHNFNWWDATGAYPTVPGDGHGHGTHTTGTMVGDDGADNQIGMAPGAQTVHCKNMTDGGSGDDNTFLTCFEWDLAPWDLSGNNPTPAYAPDSINNSWGYWGGGQNQFRTAINALQAAGIVVEVSAGNEGSGCQSLRSPGDYEEVFTTGSVQHSGGVLPGTITGFSSRGPSSLDGDYFPDFMAPGENIRSSVPGGGFQGGWSGTSMSGPHVTALIGLIWSANPALRGQIDTTYAIIQQTVVPLTGQNGSNCGGDYSVGPNNDWGYGTIDALAAVNLAISYGGAGTLEGTVTDSVTSLPVAGATVQAIRQEGGVWTLTTNGSGFYSSAVAAGTFNITASHPHYVAQTVNDVVVAEDGTTTQDFDLTPRGWAYGYVYDFDNSTPIVGATVTAEDLSTTTTNGAGYYELWLDVGEHTLTAVAEDYAPENAVVNIVSGYGTMQDFYLQAAVVFVPSPIEVSVPLGSTYTQPATITNRQPWDYAFEFRESDNGYLPLNGGQASVVQDPVVPVGNPVVPQGASSNAEVQPFQARINDNTIVVLTTTDVSQSVEAALIQLGYTYDLVYGPPWTGVDFTPYDVVFVTMDGGLVEASDVQLLRTEVLDEGKKLVMLGGTCWQGFAQGMNDYIVQNDVGNYCWQVTNPPQWTLVDPSHPLADGLPDSYNYMNYSAGYYQIRVNDPDAETVAVNGEGYPAFFRKTTNGDFIWYIDSVYSSYWTDPSDFAFLTTIINNSINAGGGDVMWLSESPITGTIPADSSLVVDINFDASPGAGVTQPGTYSADLTVRGEPSVVVPVTMFVEAPEDWGRLEGTVSSLGYCDANPAVLEGALVEIVGVGTFPTDADGYFATWLPEGTYTVNVTADGHFGVTSSVTVVAQQNTTANFNLRWDQPCITADPLTMSATLEMGETDTQQLTLTNNGAGEGTFEMSDMESGYTPMRQNFLPAAVRPSTPDTTPSSFGRAPNAPSLSPAELNKALSRLAGEQAYAVDVYPGYNLVTFLNDNPGDWTVVAGLPNNQYFGGDFINGDFSTLYVVDYATNSLYTVDTATGATTLVGPSVPGGGESWTGLTGATDGTMYGVATTCGSSTLYTVDLGTGGLTTIGNITNGPCVIDIAVTPAGEMFGVDIVNDNLVQIDPATGAGTVIGYIGFNANYAQGMDYEETSGTLYLAAYGSQGELRIADPATGNSTLVGAFPGGAEVDSLAFATGGGGDALWLTENPESGTIPGTLAAQGTPARQITFGEPQANPGLTAKSPTPDSLVAPKTPANPEDVLWDQPLSSINQNAYVNQDFTDFADYSSFLADDFTNTESWDISSFFVPGNGWNGFSTLMNASSLTWQVYADNAGIPIGDPYSGGAIWSLSLLPTDPQVVITNGTGGMPSDVTLNLDAPLNLPSGHYWFVFYPSMPFSGGGQYGRQPADTTNGYTGQFINPVGGFGYGTVWQAWTVLGVTQQDMAFRLEGTISAGSTAVVDVTFDAGQVALPGTYTGQVKAKTNDPVVKNYTVDVTMFVNAPADWGKLEGIVNGLGYCDEDSAPLQGAMVQIVDGLAVETDENGHYILWLQEGTYDVVVTADGHTVGYATVLIEPGGVVTTQNFDLRWTQPCLTEEPASLEVTLDLGATQTEQLTLSNSGAAEGTFEVKDSDKGYTPKLARKPVSVDIQAAPAVAPDDTAIAAAEYKARPAGTVAVKPSNGINQLNVMLLAADDDNGGYSPIRDLLLAYGDLGAIDLFDPRNTTPTLDQLQAYDVVVVWANYTFADPVGIGNVLADYVDEGGKVVDLMFALDPNWGYQGRFRTEGYTAMTVSGTAYTDSCLGDFDDGHPIMEGVTDVCDYYRGYGSALTPDSVEVARWQDNELFVAVKDSQSVATINAYVGVYFQYTGQMADVLHNAIIWLGEGGGGDALWLTEDPMVGTVAPDTGEQIIDVTFDASLVTQPGTYMAEIKIKTNDPVNTKFTIPAVMNVNGPEDWGRIEGNGSSLGYCDENPVPAEGATVEIVGGPTLVTDADGHYSTWMPEGTYTVNFSAENHVGHSATVVIVAQQTTYHDFGLRLIAPCVAVSPEALEITLAPDTQSTLPLALVNDGAGDADFKVSEMLNALGLGNVPAGSISLNLAPAGSKPDLTVVSPASALVAVAPAANPEAVLWDQPLSSSDQNAYVNQDFTDFDDYDSYLADDFVNEDSWEVSTIFVPGNGWNGFSTLMNAQSLTWAIFADDGGVPDGDPRSGGAVWSITLAPSDPQVTITNGSGGMPSNATLNLTDPVTIEDGHWWLVFYPSLAFSGGGQYGRQPADTANAYTGQFINPGGGFGYGTAWQDWTVIGPTQQDIAFRLEGEIASMDIPWLSEDPTEGTVAADSTTTVAVTFDATGLAFGDYTGTLRVKTGDPNNATVLVPVILHVAEAEAPVASFTATTVLVGNPTEFTNTSEPGIPAADEYNWDFGDGITMTVPTAEPVFHTYATFGTFAVTLEACNVADCDTFTAEVVVLPMVHYLPVILQNGSFDPIPNR